MSTEHDPALVEKAAELIGECDDEPGWTDAPDSDGNGDLVYECSCGDTSPVLAKQWVDNDAVARAATWHRQHIARAVLDAVAPAIRDAAVEDVARRFQFGGWTILTAPPPAGAIPSVALGQRVTEWLRAQQREERL